MVVVIGGHSRKIGKTSVMAGLIGTLPEAGWTAIKISANHSGSGDKRDFVLAKEKSPSNESDSGRYLAAGAMHSYWLRASDAQLAHAVPVIRTILQESRNVIIESNRLLEYVRPDLYLVLLDFRVEDFKKSVRRFLHLVDSFLLIDRGCRRPPWKDIPLESFLATKTCLVQPPDYVTPELVHFIRHTAQNRTTLESGNGTAAPFRDRDSRASQPVNRHVAPRST